MSIYMSCSDIILKVPLNPTQSTRVYCSLCQAQLFYRSAGVLNYNFQGP